MQKPIAVLEDCCAPLTGSSLDAQEADDMSAALKVLADPARLRIVNILASVEELCVCDFVAPLGLSQPTVSHHLRVLSDAGLLTREQRGRWVYYRLVAGPLRTLADAIAPALPDGVRDEPFDQI